MTSAALGWFLTFAGAVDVHWGGGHCSPARVRKVRVAGLSVRGVGLRSR